ncbi:MAG: bifunctional 2-polyprenyl-6-hydroxyphenol methylase/3-demethylubiquinol 3-O-methyltransferase UbiG [Desulfobacteraceae bacterium]|jgi:2-polyprenyl-6-hydroxyphenyl methylase/3-demethylubiquinone-9 3-methyltransferase
MVDHNISLKEGNIDPLEIHKFDQLADKWWDPAGELAALHHINPTRLAYVRRNAGLEGKKVLDVGCGGGLLAEAMAKAKAHVTAIDASIEGLTVARKHLTTSDINIDYRLTSAEEFAKVAPAQFDVVTCMELIEHVPNPASLVNACSQLVRPGGHLFFATVNRTLPALLLVIFASEYLFGIVRKGTHQYKKFIRPEELAAYAKATGMVQSDLTGLRYLPFLNYSALCSSTMMNYMMHFQKPLLK